MIIRKATYADAIAMSQIRNEAARTGIALWTSHQILPGDASAWLKPALERGTAVVAVDEHDQVLGYATAEQWRAYEAYEHSVENSIYIRTSARGQGLGKQLLAALLAASKAVGDKLMMAFIESGNIASVDLHSQAGFKLECVIPRAGTKFGQDLDLTIMSCHL